MREKDQYNYSSSGESQDNKLRSINIDTHKHIVVVNVSPSPDKEELSNFINQSDEANAEPSSDQELSI